MLLTRKTTEAEHSTSQITCYFWLMLPPLLFSVYNKWTLLAKRWIDQNCVFHRRFTYVSVCRQILLFNNAKWKPFGKRLQATSTTRRVTADNPASRRLSNVVVATLTLFTYLFTRLSLRTPTKIIRQNTFLIIYACRSSACI